MTHYEITPELRGMMNDLARGLDEVLNGKGRPKTIGFALLTYNLDEDLKGTGRINYIGNGQRSNVLIALKELVARWEGRYAETAGRN